jgi:ATP-dependent Clp protease ATP-binding subunit ClpA
MDIINKKDRIEIFCCYAREDQELLLTFKKHLKPLEWQGLITLWSDIDINGGMEWENEIKKHLNSAQIILLFVSPDFMQSDYCYSTEMGRAMERHEHGEACVIPIILRPTLWRKAAFRKLQVLPTNAEPVTSRIWHTPDDAFLDITEGIEKKAEEILKQISTKISQIHSEGINSESTPENSIAIKNASIWQKHELKREINEIEETTNDLKTTIMDQLGVDLTAEVRAGNFKSFIGRNQEMERIIQILSRRNKNNPILVGKPGTGKTSIVTGLAQRLVAGEVPQILSKKNLRTLDIGSLLVNTRFPGEHLRVIIEEMRNNSDCILFIDNIPKLLDANTTENMRDIVQLFKLALSRGEFQCLGTSTPEDYESMIKHDVALQGGFEKIYVNTMTVKETVDILKGICLEYERHHQISITNEALKAVAELADRYVSDYFLPGNAIALLDEVSSQVSTFHSLAIFNVKEAMKSLESVLREIEDAIGHQEYLLASELYSREMKLRGRINKLEMGWVNGRGLPTVSGYDIVLALPSWFEKVRSDAMTVEETINVLKDIRLEYEQHYHLSITDEALKATAELANRYMVDGSLPSKAIVLLDEASSQSSPFQVIVVQRLKEAMKSLESVLRMKEDAIEKQNHELATKMRDSEVKPRDHIGKLERRWQLEKRGEGLRVDKEAIFQIISAEV